MSLHETQALFHALATHPEPAAQAARTLGLAATDLAATFVGDARLPVLARLAIYGDMYFFRIRDVLREQFADLATLLGDAAFHDLIVDYLVACPPNDHSIGRVGERLPAFVALHPLAARHPNAAPLARRAWAELDVFDGEDALPLTLPALAALAPDAFATLPLTPIPCLRLLREPAGATIVWRRDVEVLTRPASALEADALAFLLAAPRAFGELCAWLATDRTPDEAAQLAFELLGRWAAHAMLNAAPRLVAPDALH